jgi:opacity protein-like surface antigen
MKSLRSMLSLISFMVLVGFEASGAEAVDGFIQFSVGEAGTEDSDFEIDGFGTIPHVEFEDSVSVDLTGGAWFPIFDLLDIGVHGSLGYYRPQVETVSGFDDLDFHLAPLSMLGMVRIPLFKTDRLPHGFLQPFAGIGPEFLLSYIEVDEPGVDDSAVGFDVGFDFRAGVNVNVTRLLAFFVQYKRTEVDAELSDGGDDLEIDFESNHITAGIGFHF